MSDSRLTVATQDDVTVVGFAERAMLDLSTVDAVADDLLALAEPGRQTRLVVDFTNVNFLSSIALSMLLKLRRRADVYGGEVVLAQVRSEVMRLFRITRLDKLFLTFDSVEEAVAHFRA
jgi:anti-sigma B factor antagonist